MYWPRFNSKRREALWQSECLRSAKAGRGRLPICNICDLPVAETDAWDGSHHPARPKVFGGRSVGIAHHRCNLEHGARVVTPARARPIVCAGSTSAPRGPDLANTRCAAGGVTESGRR
jgi:hypothetical protein